MLVEDKLIEIIEAHTGFQCFLDEVPDAVTLPALAINNLSYGTQSTRVLSGKRTGHTSEHRISLICNTMDELDELVKSVELLDNTSNDYFQKIYTDFSNREARQDGSNVVRAFYNVTAIK